MLAVLPTLEMQNARSRGRIDPLIEDSPR